MHQAYTMSNSDTEKSNPFLQALASYQRPRLTQEQKIQVKKWTESIEKTYKDQPFSGVDKKRKFYEHQKDINVDEKTALKKHCKEGEYKQLHKNYLSVYDDWVSLKEKWIGTVSEKGEAVIEGMKYKAELTKLKAKREGTPDEEREKLKKQLQRVTNKYNESVQQIKSLSDHLKAQVDTRTFDLFVTFANTVFTKEKKFRALYRRFIFLTGDHVVASAAGLASSKITHESMGPNAVLDLLFKVLEAPYSQNKPLRMKHQEYKTLFFNGKKSKLNTKDFRHKLWTTGFGIKSLMKFAEFRNETADRIRRSLGESSRSFAC